MNKRLIGAVALIAMLVLAGCSVDTGHEANSSSGETVEGVQVIKMQNGVTCYIYEGSGISCLELDNGSSTSNGDTKNW